MSQFQELIDGEISEIKSPIGNEIKVYQKLENDVVEFELSTSDHSFTSFVKINISSENDAIIDLLSEMKKLNIFVSYLLVTCQLL